MIAGHELRRLDARRWYKPLDVGEAGVACSVNPQGRLLVMTAPHPQHGQVQLTAAPELSDRWRFDQPAVRRYRARLSTIDAAAFGLAAPERRARHAAWLWQEAIPVTALAGSGKPGLVTLVPHPDDVGGARGVVQVRLAPDGGTTPARFTGRLRLARAPYPQLTEGGPLPLAARRPELRAGPSDLMLTDPGLGFAAVIGGDLALTVADSVAALDRGWLRLDAPLRTSWRRVVIGMGSDAEDALDSAQRLSAVDADDLIGSAAARWGERWQDWPDAQAPLAAIARRGLAYAVGCCAVPIDDSVCLVTDHRLLPLAWTRDAYFVARALLDWSLATANGLAVELVRGHLAWLFRVAHRPDGWWARSHLIGGQRKDQAYQLDQQLYPLLELADYVAATADRRPVELYASQLPAILRAVEARSHPVTGLLATDETPADDPTAYAYQTANQILAWRAFSCLAALGVGGSALGDRADRIRTAVRRHLVTSAADGSRVLAYAIDGNGRARHYHDANDLPLALASRWGFNAPDDAIWRATVQAAFAPTHQGFAVGARGGLSSVHTPGAWPLGQLQQLLVADALGDRWSARAAQRALRRQAQWDDLLPEASDPTDGRPVSRPWFAWPGALAASAQLTESRLTADRT